MGARTVALTGVLGQGLVGTDVATKEVAISGVSGSGSVGTMAVAARLIGVTGVQSTGSVGTFGLAYWSLIDDSQSITWQNINNS
jgi:hypothetical protein